MWQTVCRKLVLYDLQRTIQKGTLSLQHQHQHQHTNVMYGKQENEYKNVVLKVMDDQFLVDVVMYGDEGLARENRWRRCSNGLHLCVVVAGSVGVRTGKHCYTR